MRLASILSSMLLLVILLTPCDAARDKCIEIATFNIEHLTCKGKDIKQIARVIKDLGLDVVGIQEIEDLSALEKLVSYLDGFKYKITSGNAPIHVGIIYNSSTIDVSQTNQITSLILDKPKMLRPGLSVRAKVKPDGFDFTLAVVHLKSKGGASEEKTDLYRKQQIQCLSDWIDTELRANPKEKDIIIVGDFNESLERSPFVPLINRRDVKILTGDLPPGNISYIGKQGNRRYQSLIDHIVLYKGKGGAFEEYKAGSISLLKDYSRKYPNYDIPVSPDGFTAISDHLPVYAVFSTRDND
ncbi:endonuclease/exonuclease/phosphatase family protein [Candidatus Desantisbacteria bacterium]|nr:endonuclease/exonuclease/phosphatase family protein [Candidatus Desantisbacteria bacterium]